MATIRSSSGSSSISAFKQRGLARPRPPGDEDVPAGRKRGAGGPEDRLRQRAHAHQVFGRERPPPEPSDRDGDLGSRGRRADGDPRSVAEPGVQDRPCGGIEPERPGDVDRGAVEPGGRESGRVVGLEPAASLDPDVAGSVDHDLGDLGVLQEHLQAR